jgi:diacylglycerol kinase family enzyme
MSESNSTIVPVIINAAAGAGNNEETARVVTEVLRAGGLQAQVLLARKGTDVVAIARKAALARSPIIAAGGGDGTISSVATALVGTEVALGILPLGTLNHFAKDLRIPLDLTEALRVIVNGQVRHIDVGEVNGRIFINNSSLGLYPYIVRRREKQQERLGRGKWPAFFWAALTVLRRYPFLDVRLSTDEGDFIRRTPLVFIGNNEYIMEGFDIGTRGTLADGKLSLYVVHHTGRWGLLRLAARALFGNLRESQQFDALYATEVLIETRRRRQRLRVATDGEVTVLKAPLQYRLHPGALRVITPAPEDNPET